MQLSSKRKQSVSKTNALRLLDQHQIPHEVFTYDADIVSAEGVAGALGIAPGLVCKTLVLLTDTGKPLLVMVPGDQEVNLRMLARNIGARRVSMATKQQAQELTRLQTGGIGALALVDKGFDVYLYETACASESILVNGGRRGLNVLVPVPALIELTSARLVRVT